MKLIFGTTNNRKVLDLENVIKEMNLDIQVLGMEDINWDLGEIDENGLTIEENSLIKARAILSFCLEHNISYPIVTDDSGLFVDALNGEPGIYTARYADDEREKNPELPIYQCVIKLLRNLEGIDNRSAKYKSSVTVMMPNGKYYQVGDESKGTIAYEVIGDLTRPYIYSVFILDGTEVAFNQLDDKTLYDTYRHKALRRALKKLK